MQMNRRPGSIAPAEETPGAAHRSRTAFTLAPPALACVAAALYLLAHALVIPATSLPARLANFGFLVGTPLVAAACCLVRWRRDRHVRGWLALALAAATWAGGMAATAAGDILIPGTYGVATVSVALFVLYGVPLFYLLAAASERSLPVRLLDGAVTALLGCQFFVFTLTFTTLSGVRDDGLIPLRLMLDIENVSIALFALIRHRAAGGRNERALLAVTLGFAIAYLLAAAFVNHVQADAPYGSLGDLVIDVPFLLLAALALVARPTIAPRAASEGFVRIVRVGSPLMPIVSLMAISALLADARPDAAVAGCIAAMIAYAARTMLAQMQSLAERERLERLTRYDGLTGLANRRAFDEALSREWRRAERSGEPLALLMIDIDRFKLLNDRSGHAYGDHCLREVAQALARTVRRSTDLVARFGGEEFACVLPATDAHAARTIAEAMRAAVRALRLASPADGGIVTVSIGVAAIPAIAADSGDRLTGHADAALYRAKAAGRDRVETA